MQSVPAAKVMCFPPIAQPHVRRTGDNVPVKWTACRGPLFVDESDAIAMMSGRLVPDWDGDEHRVCYRCPKRTNIIVSEGVLETRRCTVCCRKNKTKEHKLCKFSCQARFDSMVEQDQAKRPDTGVQSYIDRYVKALCKGAMRVGLSCNKLGSDAVLSMARELIQVGIDAEAAAARVPKQVKAVDIAIDYSRPTWESELRRVADLEAETLVKEYQTIQYINLKIDAGSVLNAHVTHALIDSPWSDAAPLILHVSENSQWDVSNYEEFLVAHLQHLESFEPKLIVCSIVHDNLAAQANAVSTVVSHWDTIPKIIDVPCLNHMVNLVFTQSVKDCHALDSLVGEVIKWQSLCSTIGLRTPSVPQTRWLYIVEVIRQIMSVKELPDALAANMDAVFDCLGHEATEAPSEFLLLLDILDPLYVLSHELERRKTRLSDVIPLIQECLSSFKRVTEALPEDCDFGREIIHCLVSNLIARLRANAYDEIVTSYVLTLKGQAEVKARLCTKTHTARCRLCAMLELNHAMANSPEDFKLNCWKGDEGDVSSSDPCEESLAEEYDSGKSDVAGSRRGSAHITVTQQRRRSYQLNYEVMPYANLEEILAFDLLDDVLAVTRRCLLKHGGVNDEVGITDTYYQVALDEWIVLNVDPLVEQLEAFHGQNLTDIDWKLWAHMSRMAKGDENWKSWEQLSRVALVFISAAPSEAEVERLLSKQKYIQRRNVTNISMDGLTARLQLFGDRSIDSVNEAPEDDIDSAKC